jgi:hypothetical protein
VSEHLKDLADASLAAEEAEEALEAGERTQAEEALDRGDAVLAALRGSWGSMGAAERAVVGPSAKAVRERLDAARRRLPKRAALSEGAPEADPEEELEP